jgi:hypothetical protein
MRLVGQGVLYGLILGITYTGLWLVLSYGENALTVLMQLEGDDLTATMDVTVLCGMSGSIAFLILRTLRFGNITTVVGIGVLTPIILMVLMGLMTLVVTPDLFLQVFISRREFVATLYLVGFVGVPLMIVSWIVAAITLPLLSFTFNKKEVA